MTGKTRDEGLETRQFGKVNELACLRRRARRCHHGRR